MKRVSIISLFLIISIISFAQTGQSLFDQNFVHEIRVSFPITNFRDSLTYNYQSSIGASGTPTNIPYLMGVVNIDGNTVDSIGVRQKGFSSHFSSNDFKKSLKIKLNEYVSGQKYEGLKKFNLSNGVGDPAILRDILAYNLMSSQGIEVPRTSYARVYLNNVYWGLYLIVEQVDKTFVNDNFINGNGNLYKNIGNTELKWLGNSASAYTANFELKTNESQNDWTAFINLIDVINNSSNASFADTIQKVFDVDYYLRVLAVDIITNNWDSYIEHGRNFYMYQEPTSQLFYWIPWDYNLSFGGDLGQGGGGGNNPNPANCPTILSGACPYPAIDTIFLQVISNDPFCCQNDWDGVCQQSYDDILQNGNNPSGPSLINFSLILNNADKILIHRLMAVPKFKEKYLNYCCQIMKHDFTESSIFPLVNQFGSLIDSSVQADTNYNFNYSNFVYDTSSGNGSSAIPSIKEFITYRTVSVDSNFIAINFDCNAETFNIVWHDIVINEFMAQNDSIAAGIADQNGGYDDWIELYNNTSNAIDLSYYYLSDKYSNLIKWSFPYGDSIASGQYLIVWADGQAQETGYHSNFSLNSAGEQLVLSHLDGTVIDSISFGLQNSNVAQARIPNGTGSFTPQNSTFGVDNETVGIDEFSKNVYQVFPNPTKDYFTLNIILPQIKSQLTASLININGQEILQKQINGGETKYLFDVSKLSPGMYLLKIHSNEGMVFQKRVIIQ